MKKELTLSNGNKIPTLAYGTWLIDNKIADRCVLDALKAGYRHIDTAQAYRNEVGVGKGIKESGISRQDIYVTTKVEAEYKSYLEAKNSIDESLKKLDLDYVDLVLIHCPQPWNEYGSPNRYFKENIEVWKALEEAYLQGKVKAIGVSNFLKEDLENIINHCQIKPMINQVLCHIGHTPLELIKYCKEHEIIFESYSPMGHAKILDNEEINLMAEKYHVSVAQLCIKYTLQLETISIPKAQSLSHIIENTKLDFEISKSDMDKLISLDFKINYLE